jgi:hypothetical protein
VLMEPREPCSSHVAIFLGDYAEQIGERELGPLPEERTFNPVATKEDFSSCIATW